MEGVYKSMHPIKAVVAWGKNAKEIVKGHEKSKTPYYWDTPYGWLIKNSSKSLGLDLKNMPMFHAVEDTILENKISLYQDKLVSLTLKKLYHEEIIISTKVPNPIKMNNLIEVGDYVKTLCLDSYKREDFGYVFCYMSSNQDLYKRCKFKFNNNNNYRYKK